MESVMASQLALGNTASPALPVPEASVPFRQGHKKPPIGCYLSSKALTLQPGSKSSHSQGLHCAPSDGNALTADFTDAQAFQAFPTSNVANTASEGRCSRHGYQRAARRAISLVPPEILSAAVRQDIGGGGEPRYDISQQGGAQASASEAASEEFATAWASGEASPLQAVSTQSATAGRFAMLKNRRKQKEIANAAYASPDTICVDGYKISRENVPAQMWWSWFKWFYGDWLKQENVGLQNLPLDKGIFFMASNHTSHLDCGATFMAAWAGGAKRVYALGARDYFFRNPFKAWFVTTIIGVIPFSRRGFSQQEIDVLLQVKESSSPSNPTAVLIFPEGTRSVSGSLGQFKAGVGLLAEQLDIPVVPVAVKGTLDAMPKGTSLPYRHKIRVEFGHPLDFQEFQEAEKRGGCQETAGESKAGVGAGSDKERRKRRETQKRFAAAIRSAVLVMLKGYGQGRKQRSPGEVVHRPALAQLLGGGKWNLIGWWAYWLPMSLCMVLAVGLAAAQVYATGAGVGMAGRLGVGAGYAAVAGVFQNLQGAWQNTEVLATLGVMMVAFYVRDLMHGLWPYVVLHARDD